MMTPEFRTCPRCGGPTLVDPETEAAVHVDGTGRVLANDACQLESTEERALALFANHPRIANA